MTRAAKFSTRMSDSAHQFFEEGLFRWSVLQVERYALLAGVEVGEEEAALRVRLVVRRRAAGCGRDHRRSRSTLMTSAPKSARSLVQYGPATWWVRSRTRTPCSALSCNVPITAQKIMESVSVARASISRRRVEVTLEALPRSSLGLSERSVREKNYDCYCLTCGNHCFRLAGRLSVLMTFIC